ncbi:unnamed protein product [Lota lota]
MIYIAPHYVVSPCGGGTELAYRAAKASLASEQAGVSIPYGWTEMVWQRFWDSGVTGPRFEVNTSDCWEAGSGPAGLECFILGGAGRWWAGLECLALGPRQNRHTANYREPPHRVAQENTHGNHARGLRQQKEPSALSSSLDHGTARRPESDDLRELEIESGVKRCLMQEGACPFRGTGEA